MEQNSRSASVCSDVHTFCAMSAIGSLIVHSENSFFKNASTSPPARLCRRAHSTTMSRTAANNLSGSTAPGQCVRSYARRYLEVRNVT